MRSAELPADLADIAREATRNGAARRPRRAPRASSGSATTCRPRSCPTARSPSASASTTHWIQKRTGIKSRRRAAAARDAGRVRHVRRPPRARRTPASTPRDVDLVLVATMTPDDITPNAAPVVAAALGAVNAGAIDIGAACTGWLAALRLAAGQVETGRADRVLVIGAELLTRITDFDDPKTAALFGDGAGAVLARRRGRGRHRPDRAAPPTATLADRITATHDRPRAADGRPLDLPGRGQAPERGHRRRRRARRASSSRTSTSSSTTRPTAGSSAPSASGSTSSPRRWPTTSPTWPTPRPPRSRSRSRCCARTGGCGRARRSCSPPSARASPGAPASSSGGSS